PRLYVRRRGYAGLACRGSRPQCLVVRGSDFVKNYAPSSDEEVRPVTLTLNDTSAPGPANLAPAKDARAGAASLLGSFVIAARQRGVHLSVAQLIRDHQLASGEVSVERLLRIAAASGLRAKATRLHWANLVKMGTALPAIVVL